MSRIVIVTCVVAVLVAGAVVPASAQLFATTYVLKCTDESGTVHGVLVEEHVDAALGGGFWYKYTVFNNRFLDPSDWGVDVMGLGSAIVEFGFSEGLGGGPITVAGAGPNPDWSVAGEASSPPQPVWSTDIPSSGIPDPATQNNFTYTSFGEPHMLYSAFVTAVGGDGEIGTSDDVTATGQISGPTGEDFVTFTYTPGGWGAKPRGENPGTVLHNNFDSVYPVPPFPAPPNGPLVIGGDYTITFTEAQAITDFLPSGGKPGVLEQDYTDPDKKTEPGEFASQVLALQLNVDFSNAGVLPDHLADWHLDSGPLMNNTVAEVLASANIVLGGGQPSQDELDALGLTVSGLNDVLAYINEKFVP